MAGRTQELDPGDILEVRDMAEVIARAEQIVTAPRSSNRSLGHGTDIFDALVRHPAHPVVRMPTDDAIGPATPAPHAVISVLPAPLAPQQYMAQVALPPIAASSLVLTVPVATEDDAYYAPGGRVRSFADVTLDGYRPEPTMLVRARARRRNFTAIAVAVLLPVIAIAAIAFFGHQETATAATSTTTIATATLPAPPKPVVAPAIAPAVTAKTITAAALPAAAPKSAAKPTRGGAVPTFDVNSLPTAKAK